MGVSRLRTAFTLVPEVDVVVHDGRMVSLSSEPWLRLSTAVETSRFLEIVYRASLLDDPVRPVLRFLTDAGPVDRILPGPAAGAGIWRGAAPKGVRAIWISPTNRPGRFDFEVESVRSVGLAEMLAGVWRRKPKKLWSFFIATIFGFVAEAENALDWAANSEPVDEFESWRAPRERAFDTDRFDQPRFPWAKGPLFAIVVSADEPRDDALARTLDSVRGQVYERWRLVVVVRPDGMRARFDPTDDERISFVDPDSSASPVPQETDFVAHLEPGDELAPHALACFAEEASRRPQARLIYADEIVRTEAGDRPTFKPNWSPLFEAARPYLGRCAFWSAASRCAPERRCDRAPDAAFAELGAHEVAHLRRWLMSRGEDNARVMPATKGEATALPAAPSVSIILSTRDRPDILGPCIDSVLRRSTHPSFELIVVDNGSRRADTLRILDAAAQDERVRILKRPGPFNFASLNNDAARVASGEVLVFLNNDTVVVSGDWLEQLSRQAVDPMAGAVGALLLFPDERIQHAGVVVGLGQDAGHFEALARLDASSWLDRVHHLHETSAVTAACMAVERRKFESVDGFDAVNLPIEFNDTDLCLRLAERGWTSRYVPTARLIHLESATRRNARFRPMSVYAKERDYFRRRWRPVIRDDPFFHPALSLYARHLALW